MLLHRRRQGLPFLLTLLPRHVPSCEKRSIVLVLTTRPSLLRVYCNGLQEAPKAVWCLCCGAVMVTIPGGIYKASHQHGHRLHDR